MASAAIFAMAAATIAQAAAPVVLPIQFGHERLRYVRGRPTLELHGRNGIVEVTPLPMDHGCLSFGVMVVNESAQPSDIDVYDITATVGEQRGIVLTARQLDDRASKRAFWTSMAVGAVGGLAAGIAAAGDRPHYTVRTHTSHRGTVSRVDYHSGGNAADSAIIASGTGATIASINEQRDRAGAAIGEDIVQRTTVDPGDSYGGRIVIDKIAGTLPQTVALTVAWNGEVYTTKWQVASAGTPAPAFVAGPAQIRAEPALFVTENRIAAPAPPIGPAVAARPKHHPNDDTVEVPM